MTFYDLYKKLSVCYPDRLRCEWDNDGIMCSSDLYRESKKILISLDVTSDTVAYAKEKGFDTIISHHPLVFRSQKSLTPMNYTQNKLINLVKGDINVMSFHTRLDAAQGGVNDTLCSILSLSNVTVDTQDSIGRIGYTSIETVDELARTVKACLGAPAVFYSGNKKVNKVYVVGGDGKDLIENAIFEGCDTIVTGRASYNIAIDACDMGINIIEAGHFYTEHPVCISLEKKVKELLPDAQTEIYFSNKISMV